ncbi:hypothetical protein NECAME_16890 [Necator americanus]|uniref:Uncharacterized protein n=1 Tax=Necator americanus TaxID=51031 RepID=W2TTQ9_NECAM|nr:hypothetical protein NECAME_16890 [Necator americanus]ETN85173.1 hypothetical protein NECAME_16890 [Necator americanus]
MTDDKMHPIYNLTAVGLRSDFPYVNLNSRCIRIDCPYPGTEVEFTMPIGYIYTGYFIKEAEITAKIKAEKCLKSFKYEQSKRVLGNQQ